MKRPPTEAALPWANSDHGHLRDLSRLANACRADSRQSFRARLQENHRVAPHKYLSDLRVEEAKRVMLTTKLPLRVSRVLAREDLQLRHCPGQLAVVEQSRAVGCTHQSRWCQRVFRTFHRMRGFQLQSRDRVGFSRWPVSRERRRKWRTHRTTAAPQ